MLTIDTVTCQVNNEKILYVSWKDYDPFMKLHFEAYFFSIIDRLRQENIKKLILDCSCRRHHPSATDFKEIFELFLSGLSTSNLQKMARICPQDPKVSLKLGGLLENIKEELDLDFELQNFKTPEAAQSWLVAENNLQEGSRSNKSEN